MLGLLSFPDFACRGDEMARAARGCGRDALRSYVVAGSKVSRCPLEPFCHDPEPYLEVLRAHRFAQVGILPFGGTWADQPQLVLDVLDVVDQVSGQVRSEQQRRDQEKTRAKAPPRGTRRGR